MAELSSLGRYKLVRVLGRGAMGVVYEGLDPSLNRRVAVKTILRNAAIDEETARAYSAQFAREAQAAGRLNHPNIVQVHDFAVEGDVAYLVMEYIQGRELRSFFEAKEKFTIEESVRIMGELLDALDLAHEAGVIHRDIKPANVMLDAQRRVKLADFGVARIQDSERSAAGTMVGTPAFMSPEQIQGAKIDRRTDIFSAGVVLYQLLTGEQPFTGAGAWTVAKKIMQDDPPPPSGVVKSISPVFDGIVNKALAKNAAERYASAREFASALRGAAATAQPSFTNQPAATATLPPGQPAAVKPGAKATEAEVEFWRAIQNSSDAAEFEFYLEQFPDGTYAPLARHKIAKLKEPAESARKASEETLRLEAEAKEAARRQEEAEEQARIKAEAEAFARAQAEESRARREAEERARKEAETRARVEAEVKAQREAAEKAKRAAEEKARQAAALAKLKQQEAAEKAANAAAVDPDATVAMARRAAPAAAVPVRPASNENMPVFLVIGVVVVIAVGVIGYFMVGGKSAPVPVAEAPAPAVDVEKIRRETEERVRKEFADKAAVERAAMEKTVAEKAAAEKAATEKLASAKTGAEKEAAERAAQKATADRVAAEKAAAEKAASAKAVAEKAAADKAAAEKLAAEKAVAEKAAAEKAVAKPAPEVAAPAPVAAVAPSAPAPRSGVPGVPTVGDRWTYEGRDVARPERRFFLTLEARAVNGTTVTESGQRPNGQTFEVTHRPVPLLTNPVPGFVSFSPYLRAFQDLHDGQRWKDVDYQGLFRCADAQNTCNASARVAGKERVTVKAGTYDTTKVVVEIFLRGFGPSITAEARYWYADGVNRFVKYEFRHNGANFSQPQLDMELTSYAPAGGR